MIYFQNFGNNTNFSQKIQHSHFKPLFNVEFLENLRTKFREKLKRLIYHILGMIGISFKILKLSTFTTF